MAPLCTRKCPYPFFKVTPPGAAPDPRLKPGPVFVASGGEMMEMFKLTTAPSIRQRWPQCLPQCWDQREKKQKKRAVKMFELTVPNVTILTNKSQLVN